VFPSGLKDPPPATPALGGLRPTYRILKRLAPLLGPVPARAELVFRLGGKACALRAIRQHHRCFSGCDRRIAMRSVAGATDFGPVPRAEANSPPPSTGKILLCGQSFRPLRALIASCQCVKQPHTLASGPKSVRVRGGNSGRRQRLIGGKTVVAGNHAKLLRPSCLRSFLRVRGPGSVWKRRRNLAMQNRLGDSCLHAVISVVRCLTREGLSVRGVVSFFSPVPFSQPAERLGRGMEVERPGESGTEVRPGSLGWCPGDECC